MLDSGPNYVFGTRRRMFEDGGARYLTFVVTQNCNLACKYCYVTHKNAHGRMSFDTARRAVDFFLSQDFPQDSVVWDFIGGEPLLEIQLIDQICDYIKVESYRRNHKWKDRYLINMSTNGVLYDSKPVQTFIAKNREKVNFGLTIDGIKAKHDANRVYPDGSGSYEDVIRSVRLWSQQFPEAVTKVTVASDDLPYLYESIVHLWNLGLRDVPANVVYEDVWKPGDDQILEVQLKELADYVIDNKLWNKVRCTFFTDTIGFPNKREYLYSNACGAGRSIAVDHTGSLYPCLRFIGYSLNNKNGYTVGHIDRGFDQDKIRAFEALTLLAQSKQECIECPIAFGCTWCQGWNYDSAPSETIYHRSTAICRMHKARIRANEYYWGRLARETGMRRPQQEQGKWLRHLFIMASDDAVVHCSYENKSTDFTLIDVSHLIAGLRFAEREFFRPVILHSKSGERLLIPSPYDPLHIVSGDKACADSEIAVHENTVQDSVSTDTSILIVDNGLIPAIGDLTSKLLDQSRRVNLVLRDPGSLSPHDLVMYEEQLKLVARKLLSLRSAGIKKEVSAITDRFELGEPEDCGAGVSSLTLAPNGRLYLCPAFYLEDKGSFVGTPVDGIDMNKVEMCTRKKAPLCQDCQAFSCRRCLYLGRKYTLQMNVPSKAQCTTGLVELRVSAWMARQIEKVGPDWVSVAEKDELLDPLERLFSRTRLVGAGAL